MVKAGSILTRLRRICVGDILLSSLRIPLVIGTLLNRINQGGYWFHGEGLHVGHLILNYTVPLCVAAYSMREILHIRHHSLFTPRDFDVSPYFNIIKPALENGFDHRLLTWSDQLDSSESGGQDPRGQAS